MFVTIHQPNYLPYLGFFDKVKQSDIFIVHDDCQFVERDWQHRNKIRIFNGWKWLTVPVYKKEIPIKDVRIKNEKLKNNPVWSKAHYREIEANYSKTPYFDSYSEDVKKIYDRTYENLVDLNMAFIEFLLDAFGIDVEIKYSSEFGFNSKKLHVVSKKASLLVLYPFLIIAATSSRNSVSYHPLTSLLQ